MHGNKRQQRSMQCECAMRCASEWMALRSSPLHPLVDSTLACPPRYVRRRREGRPHLKPQSERARTSEADDDDDNIPLFTYQTISLESAFRHGRSPVGGWTSPDEATIGRASSHPQLMDARAQT